ncbi:MAG: hypothetical protein ACOC44_10950 [Promethearchaeia archaeon]
MTDVDDHTFVEKLYDVVYKLSNIAKTQSYRYQKLWNQYLNQINDDPYVVRQIPLEEEKFIEDIDYRIKTLKTVQNAMADGFHSIKSLLETLYHSYFDSKLCKKDFTEEDRTILKYLIAKKILGDLVQYNQMDREIVPLKYNIMARNYLLIKLKGQTDQKILKSLQKLRFEISIDRIREAMKEIESDGIISVHKENGNLIYHLEKELELSPKGQEKYKENLSQLIDWPTQFWRSFYNVRELNLTPQEGIPLAGFLEKVLQKTATQGFASAHYVFKNLVKYFKEIKERT